MVDPSNSDDEGTVGLLEEMPSSEFVAADKLAHDLHPNSGRNLPSKTNVPTPEKSMVQENGVLKVVDDAKNQNQRRRRSMGAGRMGSDRSLKTDASSEDRRSRSSSRGRMGGLIRNLSNRSMGKDDALSSSGTSSRPGFRKTRSGRDMMPKKPRSQDTLDGNSSHHSSSINTELNLGRPGFRKSGSNRDMMPKKPVSQDTVDGSMDFSSEDRRSNRPTLRKSLSGRSLSSRSRNNSKDGFEAVSSEEFDSPTASPQSSSRRIKLKKTSSFKQTGTGERRKLQGRSSSHNNLSNLGSLDDGEDKSAEIEMYKDHIEHLENKSEMYKDEFKRMVQEKKKLSSKYVSETSKLHEDIGSLKKKSQLYEEENKQLRAALAQAGIHPPTPTPQVPSESSVAEVVGGSSSLDAFVVARRRKSMSKMGEEEKALDQRCDVVKGPGLLLTEKHRPKPSLFFLPGLRSMPFWTQVDAGETVVAYQDKALSWAVRCFEKNAEVIAQEYQAKAKASYFDQEEVSEHGVNVRGKQSTCSFMTKGHVKSTFAYHFGRTAAILQTIRDKGLLFEGTPFGFAFFYKLHGKSRTEGNAPMNLRIRLHLPIILPGENTANLGDQQASVSNLKPAVRHVEKRRKSSGAFADRVARTSIEHYRRCRSLHEPPKQTCLSTIVAHHADSDELQVIAMGVGTKFLSQEVLHKDLRQLEGEAYGCRVRDCHAEVLCRRAFRRYLSEEMLKLLKAKKKKHDARNNNRQNDQSEESVFPILRLVVAKGPSENDNGQYAESIHFELCPNITLHAYCSSAPCGNATFKKYASLQDSIQFDSRDNSWTSDAPHGLQSLTDQDKGQAALLVKQDRNVSSQESGRNYLQGEFQPEWSSHTSVDWCPAGTSTVWSGQGSLHTCSDKLARWNCLGWQGSLLFPFLNQPIHVETLVVGRKLSMGPCRRAVCCRVQPAVETRKAKQQHRRHKPAWLLEEPFRVQHPTILANAVYMDESAAVVVNTEHAGQDIRFHSSRCWAWWRGGCPRQIPDSRIHEPNSFWWAEVIDGSTGYLAAEGTAASTAECSSLCTRELSQLALQIRKEVSLTESVSTEQVPFTLEEFLGWKHKVSPTYEAVKEKLLTHHPILKHWRRRESELIFRERELICPTIQRPKVDQQEKGLFKTQQTCGIRVGPSTRKYTLGKAMLIDDSYSHEIWNDTDSERVVLVVDLWHPDITKQERKTIIAHSNNEGPASGNDWSVE